MILWTCDNKCSVLRWQLIMPNPSSDNNGCETVQWRFRLNLTIKCNTNKNSYLERLKSIDIQDADWPSSQYLANFQRIVYTSNQPIEQVGVNRFSERISWVSCLQQYISKKSLSTCRYCLPALWVSISYLTLRKARSRSSKQYIGVSRVLHTFKI
jgi:hypothetical protein